MINRIREKDEELSRIRKCHREVMQRCLRMAIKLAQNIFKRVSLI